MDKSIARLNIEHYQKLLKTDLDETKRQTILRLLADEEATLARILKDAKSGAAKPDGTNSEATNSDAKTETAKCQPINGGAADAQGSEMPFAEQRRSDAAKDPS